jgi:His/Glu/Gln/Arg/opine family amino acid ABC transporter permease subunit
MDFDFSVVAFGLPILLRGLVNTVLFCVIALPAGLVLGSAVALLRLSHRRIARLPAAVFVEIIRDTPFLVQAFLLFYGLPVFGIRLSAATAGILVLSIHSGAYFSEAIRGAILSVPRGQMEAARALGMPYLRGMRRIVFPQMLGYLLPALTNRVVQPSRDLRDGRLALLGADRRRFRRIDAARKAHLPFRRRRRAAGDAAPGVERDRDDGVVG